MVFPSNYQLSRSAESSTRRKLPIPDRGVNSSTRALALLPLSFCLHVASLSRALCCRAIIQSRKMRVGETRVCTRVWSHPQSKTRFNGDKSSSSSLASLPLLSLSGGLSSLSTLSPRLPPCSRRSPRDESHLDRYSALSALLEDPSRSSRFNGAVSYVVYSINRVHEPLATSFAGLRDTKEKSHENNFNGRRTSTYSADEKARKRIIANECFRE